MTTKNCPFCAEEIQADALKCKHCGSWVAAPADAPPLGTAIGGPTSTRLVRSTSNKMLAGVCAGLANYLRLDPTLVRIVVALVTFFTAIVPGIIIYLILAFVIPTDDPVVM